MGIDRIGKSGPVAPVPETPEPSKATTEGEVFRVTAPAAPGTTGQIDPTRTASSPLERLRAGEIDLGGYLDHKVEEATSHLSSLPPVELDAIRRALRDRLASDPALVDLVRAATGATPPPHDD
jgi:hypothetical protein